MTRLLAILMIVSTGLLVSGAAVESGTAGTLTRGVVLTAAGDFVVPSEWAGVWDTRSTSTICGGSQIGSSADTDTLCAGAPIGLPGDDGSGFELLCTGSVDATTIDISCTESSEIFPDCQQTVTIEYDVTRTGDQSTSVVVITTTHTGTGAGCSDIPDSCIRIDGTGTRVGPAPGSCSQTPVTSASWGVIKTLYGE